MVQGFSEKSPELASLLRLEEGMRNLSNLVTDLAVIKSKVGTIETDMEGLKKALFQHTAPEGNIFDRVLKAEGVIKGLVEEEIGPRLNYLESEVKNGVVTKRECAEYHQRQLSLFSKVIIPIIVAFILAISSIFYSNVIRPSESTVNLEDIRAMIRNEMNGMGKN